MSRRVGPFRKTSKGPSIKDVRSQEGFVQCGHLSEGWFFRCGRPHFLAHKTSNGVFARTRGTGLSQCGHFADKGNKFFAILCETSFYGRLLRRILLENNTTRVYLKCNQYIIKKLTVASVKHYCVINKLHISSS